MFLRRQTQSAVSKNTLWILGLCLPLPLLRQLRVTQGDAPSKKLSAVLSSLVIHRSVGFLECSHTHFSALLSLCSMPGRHCESVIDVCPRKPCQNGGTCAVASNMPDGFICQCPPVSLLTLPCLPQLQSPHCFTAGEDWTLFTHIPWFICLAGKLKASRCPRGVILPVATPNKYGL